MRSVAQRPRKWKKKVSDRRQGVKTMQRIKEIDDLDIRIGLIQALIPAGLEKISEELQQEVEDLAGKKGKHGKANTRYGRQWGSVYLSDQKVPVEVPRVRNKTRNQEVPLKTYHKMQQPYQTDELVFKKLLNGLTMRKYSESAAIVPEVFGLSPSNMSKRFKKTTSAKLRQLTDRSLNKYDLTAMFIDGKRFSEDGIVIAVGVTIEGEKVILGLAQMNTENHRAVENFFENLIQRGLRFEEGLLFIVDGSKGIIKAINRKFKGYALIQRCLWHKRENVTSYLSKSRKITWRRKLQDAYAETTYQEAQRRLNNLVEELNEINPSASGSLKEGLSNTLTLHKLGLNQILRRSFSTTNCIESIMAQVEQYTQRVDRWRGNTHIQRWVASGLLEVEPRLKRVYGWRHFDSLRYKIKQELERKKKPACRSLGAGREESGITEEQELVRVEE